MEKLSLYILNQEYAKYLSSFENKISLICKEKKRRPFIGVVLNINDYKFYAPLSSPKPKHLKMKNRLDFYKINNGLYGVINLNNMIPVHSECLVKIRPITSHYFSKEENKYNSLLLKQLIWCNEHRETIYRNAKVLYNSFSANTLQDNIRSRCCDFKLLEVKLDEYVKFKGW